MVETTDASAPADRIRTSGDSEVSTYLEIAEAREPGQVLTPAPNAPEAVVVLARFAFEDLMLHRLEICIIPRNTNSLRVVEKIGLRNEGLAERFLEINGE